METKDLLKQINFWMADKTSNPYNLEVRFRNLSIKQKEDTFPYLIENVNLDPIYLASILKGIYPEPYKRDEAIDETPNEEIIEFLSSLLKEESIRNRFLNEFALISCLDPTNREKIYGDKAYSSLSIKEKKILIKLLSNQIDVNLPKTILDDTEFLEDVAQIPDCQQYNCVLRTLQLTNPNDLTKLIEKREETIDLLVDEYMLDSNGFFEHYQSLYVQNFVELVFERFFGACVNDTFLTANVILDASESLSELETELNKTFSDNGKEVLEILREILIKLMKRNLYPSYFTQHINEDAELKTNFNNLIVNAREIENFPKKYAKLFKSARTLFEKRVNIEIEKLPIKLKNPNGNPNVFEIDYSIPFHMLVHTEGVDSTKIPSNIIPELPSYEHQFNVSMSLLNNSHFETFDPLGYDEKIIFGFNKIPNGALMHACMQDSFTQYADKHQRQPKFKEMITNYPPTYLDIDSFMAGTKYMNELKVHATPNSKNKRGKDVMMPNYILCIDNIKVKELDLSERLEIPIVYVDTKKLNPRVNLCNGNHNSLTLKYHQITGASLMDSTNPLLI